MALFHLRASFVTRSTGRSCVAAAAYIGAKQLVDERQGIVRDYGAKSNVVVNKILASEDAPKWALDSQTLWTKVDSFEDEIAYSRFKGHPTNEVKNANSLQARQEYLDSAQTAYTFECAVPLELTVGECETLVEEFLKARFVSRGLVVDYAIHWDPGNPHFHAQITRRALDGDSFCKSKDRDIVSRPQFDESRRLWAEYTNRHLEKAGFDICIDHRSYAERGIDIEPTKHEGWKAKDLQRDGKYSRIAQENQEIRERNVEILMHDPSQIIREIAGKKSVFTRDDIEREILRRVGGDNVLFEILRSKVEGIPIPDEVGKAVNDNIQYAGVKSIGEQELYAQKLDDLAKAFTDKLLDDEETIFVGKKIDHRQIYTSKTYKEREDKIFSCADELGYRINKVLKIEQIQRFIDAKENELDAKLSEQQRKAIEYLCTGADIRVLVGKAGSGKTTLLKPVTEAYKDAGYRVLGMAFQGKAVDIMTQEIGCDAKTLDDYRIRWRKYATFKAEIDRGKLGGRALGYANKTVKSLEQYQLTNKDVVIVDEANMVGGRLWEPLLDNVTKAGAKLLIVQDPAQAKSHEAGDFGRGFIERFEAVEVSKVVRQRVDWQKKCSEALNEHKLQDGLHPYVEQSHLQWHDQFAAAQRELVRDYISDLDKNPASSRLVVSFFNDKVNRLNYEIREVLKEKGVLKEHYKIAVKEYSLNDRIVFTQNDNQGRFVRTLKSNSNESIGIKNGSLGTIRAISKKTGNVKVTLDDGRVVQFNYRTFNKFDHGYAMTIHKSEGVTADRSFVLFDSYMNANLTLIAMTRHRFDVRGYVVREQFNDFKDLVQKIGSSQHKDMVVDYTLTEETKPYFERVQEYRDLVIESSNLLSEIVDRTPDDKETFEDKQWNTFLGLIKQRNEFAKTIVGDWRSHELFVRQANFRRDTIEVHAGIRDRQLSDIECSAVITVEMYMEVSNKARRLWNNIKQTHPGALADKHTLYAKYREHRVERDSLASVIYETPGTHRQFLRVKADSKIGRDCFSDEAAKPVYWRTVKQQSASHYARQLKDAKYNRLSESQKSYHNLVKSYVDARNDAASLVAKIKQETFPILRFNQAKEFARFNQVQLQRDYLALAIVDSIDVCEPFFRDLNVSEAKLLEHAVRGEENQLAKGKQDLPGSLYMHPTRDRINRWHDANVVASKLQDRTKELAVHLLGDCNSLMSNRTTLRFGGTGKIAVTISGAKAGLWHDFSTGEGGNVFSLIQREKGGNFKESVEYAANFLGIRNTELALIKPVSPLKQRESTKQEREQANYEKVMRVAKVQQLYDESKSIEHTLAERYLREHRGIKGEIPKDVRFIEELYEPQTKEKLPALIAFARDETGGVKGAQAIYLDAKTANKANIDVKKRSYGIIKGSYVELQKGRGATYIAEGLETGLSIKEAGVEGGVLVSLGISNIRNLDEYLPDNKNSIVICADNDGYVSVTKKLIAKTERSLADAEFKVYVIQPEEQGQAFQGKPFQGKALQGRDFNDVLRDEGVHKVKEYIERGAEQARSAAKAIFVGSKQHSSPVFSTHISKKASTETHKRTHTRTHKSYQKALESHKTYLYNQFNNKYQRTPTELEAAKLDSVAEQGAMHCMVLGHYGESHLDKVTLKMSCARFEFEQRRVEDIGRLFKARYDDFAEQMPAYQEKAQRLAAVEGRLFEEFSRNCELSREDYWKIEGMAERELERNLERQQRYASDMVKSQGFASKTAEQIALHRMLLEEKHGKQLTPSEIEVVVNAVENRSTRVSELSSVHKEIDGKEMNKEILVRVTVIRETQSIINHYYKSSQMPDTSHLHQLEVKVNQQMNQEVKTYEKQIEQERILQREKGLER